MADAKAKRFDVVIVARFDRFARSVQHLLRASETFRQQGVGFVSLAENIDTTTAIGKFFYTILGAIAEFERTLMQERIKAGQARAIAQGKSIGRKFLILDRDKVRGLRHDGMSLRQISEEMGVSHQTVANICRKESVQQAQE